jgi:hypothetical protein
MSNTLGRLRVNRRTGAEPFHSNGTDLGFDLLGFWQWSSSDLVSNVTRGRLAEYIVARALGLANDVREDWAALDLVTPDGTKIEVKSAAFVQSWNQTRLSSVTFVTPATRAWDADSNVLSAEAKRQADVYVFALLCHQEKATIDPLDLSQWRFYVVPTSVLNARTRSQYSITLKSLEKLCQSAVAFEELADTIKQTAIQRHA